MPRGSANTAAVTAVPGVWRSHTPVCTVDRRVVVGPQEQLGARGPVDRRHQGADVAADVEHGRPRSDAGVVAMV